MQQTSFRCVTGTHDMFDISVVVLWDMLAGVPTNGSGDPHSIIDQQNAERFEGRSEAWDGSLWRLEVRPRSSHCSFPVLRDRRVSTKKD